MVKQRRDPKGRGMAGQTYRTGVILVITAGLLWSTMVLGLRMLDQQSTWAVMLWRSVGMVPVLIGFLLWRGGGRLGPAFAGIGPPIWLGSAMLAICFVSAIYAVQTTTAANAVFPLAVTPLISALLARAALGEPIRPATWAAIAIAAIGVFVMVGEGLSAGDIAGNLAALFAAACFAVFTVCLRWAGQAETLPAVLLGALMAILLGLVGAGATGGVILFRPDLVALTLGLGLILGVGLALFALGSRSVPAAELSLLSMIEILLSPVWVLIFLGQSSSPATLAGGAIVLVAITLNAVSGLRLRRRGAA